jgi:general secretion pathway protein G
MNRKGFTLIELIVVIAIIAILAAVVAPTAMRSVERARGTGTIEDYQAFKSACFSYNADTGQWPRTATPNDLLTNGAALANWDGPYIERLPVSRWTGAAITYVSATTGVFASVASPGNRPERYITIAGIPGAIATAGTARARLDAAIDNADGGNAGFVRDVGADVGFLISRD